MRNLHLKCWGRLFSIKIAAEGCNAFLMTSCSEVGIKCGFGCVIDEDLVRLR